MLVLTVYQSIFVLPKQAQMLKNTQLLQNKEHKEISSQEISLSPAIIEKPTKPNIKAEITEFNTTHLSIKLSNMGGLLHNVHITGDEKTLPLLDMLTLKGFEQAPFVLTSHDAKSAVYTYSDSEWRIVKHFDIADVHNIKLRIEISNVKDVSILKSFEFKTIAINASDSDFKNDRNAMLNEISILENNKIFRIGNAYKFTNKNNRLTTGSVGWVGFRDRYYAFIIKPIFETKGYENEVVGDNQLNVNIKTKEQQLQPGQTVTYDFDIVGGPQDTRWLNKYGQKYEKIVSFSNWWIFEIPAKAIYYLLPLVHALLNNWGLSIIVVGALIYGVTYPLTVKGMLSMRETQAKMQKLQPKIKAVQERYKGDQKKMHTEMAELYKQGGVNPLGGGCLLLLLQMPVFYAAYQVFWRSCYFQGQGFLWIKDLSQPDRLFILPFSLPFLGNEVNILPVMVGILMFFQQKISSKNMVTTDETQAMQQKMMKFMMPIFIAGIFYNIASALPLYFTVSYSLSTWTQWKMAKAK
ncbi:MAG: YidC/Oxa1 family insertase periplasmic-domain containing protein [Candidatus Omnitrophica bacterium]|nr:YidC/Oxa1 family insertase periplasmic-domain containing protein [Candidatus Omnitrophota bacterium]